MSFLVGLSIASTLLAVHQNQKAASAQRKSNDLQQRIADVKSQRERVKLISEARRKRATLAQNAELTGVSGSSGAIGGQSGITSQQASGISFLDTVQQYGQESNMFLNKAASAQSSAAMFGAVASVSNSFAQRYGSYESMFKTKPGE